MSGIGEIVEKYDEKALDLEVFTPHWRAIQRWYIKLTGEYFLQSMDQALALKMVALKSPELLSRFSKEALNDLFPACLKAYQN